MKAHVKIYLNEFGIGEQDVILCETPQGLNDKCSNVAVDIHHVLPKSQGGKNDIENLVSLCRNCHDKANSDRKFNQKLKDQVKRRTELLRDIPL